MRPTVLITGSFFWNVGDDIVREGARNIVRQAYGIEPNWLFFNFAGSRRNDSPLREPLNIARLGVLPSSMKPDLIVVPGLAAGNELTDFMAWVCKNKLEDRVVFLGSMSENDYHAAHAGRPPTLRVISRCKLFVGRTHRHPAFFDSFKIPYHRLPCPSLLSVLPGEESEAAGPVGFSIQLPTGEGVLNHVCSQDWYNKARIAYDEANQAGADTVLVCHHKSEFVRFKSVYPDRDIFFSPFYQDYFPVYASIACMISTRLHGCLFANANGLPGICLNDSDRHAHALEGIPFTVFHNQEPTAEGHITNIPEFKRRLMQSYVDLLKPLL